MTPSPFYNCAQMPSGQPGNRSLVPRNITQRQYPPTFFNDCLQSDLQIWRKIQRCGGLMAICPGTKYDYPPWTKMPPQGKRISPINSIPLPTSGYGTDQLVLSFRVPLGWDGVINYVVQTYTGQGFQEGSGDLTWRLQLNERWVKNLGNTTFQIGTLTQGPQSPNAQIIVQSNQLVQYFVNVAASAAANLMGGRIVCSAWGWQWPR
jgi:hypothetical protein